MKKIIILGIVATLFLSPVVALAEGTSTPRTMGGTSTKNRLQDKREELREKFEEKQGKLNELRKERISAFFDRMMKRLSTAFERLSGLVERIESRIAKLEQNNKNIKTQEAKSFLTEAKTKIANGKAFLQSAEVKADNLINTGTSTDPNPRALFQEVKDLVQKATAELRGAHESIKNAVRSIKAQGGSGTGTTTRGNP